MGLFTHLRVHTEFSLVDSIVRIKPLIKTVIERGMNAVAITDYCNLFGAVKFYTAAINAGLKPILGGDVPCRFAEKDAVTSLTFLCQNQTGYRNLTCLISKAYQQGQHQGQPIVTFEWLQEHAEGLIVLSGGRTGAIGQALAQENIEKAKQLAEKFKTLFPNRFYIEIHRTHPEDAHYNFYALQIAEQFNIPLVATNNVRFINSEDFEAHEARVCIHQGTTLNDATRKQAYSPEQYLRSAEEMVALFHDLPQAIENTALIAKRCTVKLDLGHNYLPNFPTPDGSNIENYLSLLSKQGLEERLLQLFNHLSSPDFTQQREAYDQRLQIELNVINSMGFAGYFLIVADFIQWAKNNDVPVGPGRGSGAGSLVAYALKITDLDPLEYELLFERFLNPERVSMPDFDIDFCMEGRDRVIDYVAERYGRQSVSQIITFGTMTAKAVIRDVGRALGHPYGFVDRLAKLIPFELGITLSKALKDEEELERRYQHEEEVKELIDLALKLEGVTRNAGKHAGGVVIAPSQLTDFTAIYCEQDSTQIVSQFDKDDVEAVGLVKFDFLGLRTLTIIDWAIKIINKNNKLIDSPPIDIARIPMEDRQSFNLLKACQTTAVFQLESRGMKELINRLQPDCFEEIIALVALFRPGPLQSGMVDDFINRKHGRAKVEYPHPDLEPILKPTYGVILYQEQVMQIAQVLANFTLGAADLLRRAMGKKKPEEMAKQRAIFIEGAVARDVKQDVAAHIFDLMEKFAGYGFNKSHSAAYALLAYQTAWLKAHYPAAFMAAVMSSDMDNTDKVVIFINECQQMNIQVKPPGVNVSEYQFTVMDNTTLVYGLGAIKGVGEGAIKAIIEERKAGVFTGLFDFCQRLDLRKVNRRVLEALIKSGAMDEWKIERATLAASLEKALKMAENVQLNNSSGQASFFNLFDEDSVSEDYTVAKPWSVLQRLNGEKDTLGLYLTGHPFSQYAAEFHNAITPINRIDPNSAKKAWVGGHINGLRKIMTKRGKKLIIVNLEDVTGKIDVVVYEEIAALLVTPLQAGALVIIEGDSAVDNFSGGVKLTATQLFTITEARTRFAKALTVKIMQGPLENQLVSLKSLLAAHTGLCPVEFSYSNQHARATLKLSDEWSIAPSEELLSLLEILLGEDNVSLVY